MTSAATGGSPRHRDDDHRSGSAGRAGRAGRPVWTLVALVVLAALVVGVVVSARTDRDSEARSPLVLLTGRPPVDATDVVGGTLTLTGSCLSVPAGLLVWPVGTTWDDATDIVLISHPAEQWHVGDSRGVPGTLVAEIPQTPSDVVSQEAIDALVACSRTTGIRTVAYVG